MADSAQAGAYPLVSVSVPAYNHARFVERCLDSVLRDTYPNKELVVIDDGSSDHTYAVIQAWVERNAGKLQIRFHTQKNAGISETLNRLKEHCEGEYQVFLASDDELLPGGIAKRVAYLQEHPECLAVIGDCRVIDEEGKELYASSMEGLYRVNKRRYLTKKGIKKEVIVNWAVAGPSLMVRRDIYNVIGEFDSRFLVEDWHFYLRMVERDLLGFVPDIVSAYRLHGQNQSRSNRRIKCLWDQICIAASRMGYFERGYKLLLAKSMVLCSARIVKSAVLSVIGR